MSEATQEGASVHERLVARISSPEEEIQEEVHEEVQEEEVEASPEEVTEEASSEEESEEPGREYEASEIASILGYDESDLVVDDDGKLKIKVKIDGEERLATPAELRKNFQLEGHLNKNNMEVQEERKRLQEQYEKAEKATQERLQKIDDAAQLAVRQLQLDYQNIDWADLEQNDPQEYTYQQMRFQKRQAELGNALETIKQQRESAIQERLQREQQAMLSAIPEWKDEAVMRQEMGNMSKALSGYGFTREEISQLGDHRLVLAMRDAMRYRELQESKPEVTKKVKSAPKVVKPGQPQSRVSTDEKKKKVLLKKAREGERGAVAGLLQDRWKNK